MSNRPKRRRFIDNPYYLENTDTNFYIVIKKERNSLQKIEVSKEIYDNFDRFELDDLKELNEYDRHIEHIEILENDLYKRATNKQKFVDEIIEDNILSEKIKDAINSLSKIQKRRVLMYYFDNLNLREISEMEKCSIVSVKNSLDLALIKLKEILKKFKI